MTGGVCLALPRWDMVESSSKDVCEEAEHSLCAFSRGWNTDMNIVDSSGEMLSAFRSGQFDIEKWKSYMDASVPGAKELCLKDMRETVSAGCSWQDDFLPVLNAAAQDTDKRGRAIASFRRVTEGLEERIRRRFHKDLDVDLILYLGLCSGAGWVTDINGRPAVLLGIEKIMELNWCDTDAMTGLIIHELGHVYQAQYGVLRRELDSPQESFLWQLFTEGIAMVFEQETLGDPGYFHQDIHGWKSWCDEHAESIRRSFCRDLGSMTRENQRYFGDWVSYEGHGDTGYYLGARFVRFLLNSDSFDRIICYDIREVKAGFDRFCQTSL